MKSSRPHTSAPSTSCLFRERIGLPLRRHRALAASRKEGEQPLRGPWAKAIPILSIDLLSISLSRFELPEGKSQRRPRTDAIARSTITSETPNGKAFARYSRIPGANPTKSSQDSGRLNTNAKVRMLGANQSHSSLLGPSRPSGEGTSPLHG